ncbi:hypothetical protein [Kordiimonas gwangyangensis]|uniref:hypothetical protein n=1 Tax=Kordiimonas gwangyangensis TaxID=288022 RepID=UPI000366E377|nr:hypothetical protein [Kordiimonas gwangyangensis]
MDTLLGLLFAPVAKRLDRAQRSPQALMWRAVLAQCVFLPLAFIIGVYLNAFVALPYIGPPVAALILARTIAFRSAWDNGQSVAIMAEAARGWTETITHTLARDWLSTAVLFTLGGFALWLPFRFLSAVTNQRERTGTTKPSSHFERAFIPLFDLAALMGSIWAALLFAFSTIFVPGTQLTAIAGFAAVRLRGILSRVIPLTVVAYALNFSFATRSKRSDGASTWIGPKQGRAKLTSDDLRLAHKLMLTACGLSFVTMAMLGLILMVYATGR